MTPWLSKVFTQLQSEPSKLMFRGGLVASVFLAPALVGVGYGGIMAITQRDSEILDLLHNYQAQQVTIIAQDDLLVTYEGQVSTLEGENARIKADQDILKSDHESLWQFVEGLQQRIASLIREVRSKDAMIVRLKSQIQVLTGQTKSDASKIASLEAQTKSDASKIASLEAQTKSDASQIASLEAQAGSGAAQLGGSSGPGKSGGQTGKKTRWRGDSTEASSSGMEEWGPSGVRRRK